MESPSSPFGSHARSGSTSPRVRAASAEGSSGAVSAAPNEARRRGRSWPDDERVRASPRKADGRPIRPGSSTDGPAVVRFSVTGGSSEQKRSGLKPGPHPGNACGRRAWGTNRLVWSGGSKHVPGTESSEAFGFERGRFAVGTGSRAARAARSSGAGARSSGSQGGRATRSSAAHT